MGDFKFSSDSLLTYQIGLVLEGVVEVGDPPAVAPHEDVPFLLEARRLRPLQHLPLVEDLEGKRSHDLLFGSLIWEKITRFMI